MQFRGKNPWFIIRQWCDTSPCAWCWLHARTHIVIYTYMLHVYDFCSGKVHSWPGFSFHPGPMQPLQVAQLSGIHGLQCCKSLVKLSNLELAITISYDPAVWTTQHNSPKMMLGRSGKIPCLWSQPLPLLAACSSCQVTHDFSDTPQTTEPKIEVESGLLANEDDLWSFWWGIMISHQWLITLMRVEKRMCCICHIDCFIDFLWFFSSPSISSCRNQWSPCFSQAL